MPRQSSGLTSHGLQREGPTLCLSAGTFVTAFFPGAGTATHFQPPQEIAGIPAAPRRPLSAKSALEMGGQIKSSLCAVGWDNVCHSPHFHYGDVCLYAQCSGEKCRLSAKCMA